MDSKLLGQRIKEARLAKRMTQSEVVGNFITRNMLSQIESGSAVPSMKTLKYLAEVLELSPSILLDAPPPPDNASAEEMLNQMSLDSYTDDYINAKKQFQTGDYTAALSLLNRLSKEGPFMDEAFLLITKCHLASAKEAEAAGDLAAALASVNAAVAHAGQGIYGSAADKSEALMMLSRIAADLAKQ